MEADAAAAFKALGHPLRLAIVGWLADPRAHFPPQRDGDLVADGVCVGFIVARAGVSQPTVTSHLKVLEAAGLVRSKPVGAWRFYRLMPERLEAAGEGLAALAARAR